MAALQWSETLSLDLPQMDETHREFVLLLADVENADDAQLVPAWRALVKRFNAKTPVAVRKLLGGRPAPYEPVLRKISVPTLVTHGTEDQISAMAMSEYTRSRVAGSMLSVYKGTGHATFFEEPARFDRELLALAARAR